MALATSVWHQHVPPHYLSEEGLLGVRTIAPYNHAEQRYSSLLYQRLEQLLRGRRNQLLLLRKYQQDPQRLGIMATPPGLDSSALRIPVVEKMAVDALIFLTERSPGGPVVQERDSDHRVVETRTFPTRFPHIIIERVDVFENGDAAPTTIQWCARRVQNQRSSTQINRMLDAANLTLDVVRFIMH